MAKLFWLTCFTALTDYSYLCLKLTPLHDTAPMADLKEELTLKALLLLSSQAKMKPYIRCHNFSLTFHLANSYGLEETLMTQITVFSVHHKLKYMNQKLSIK